MSLFQLGKFTSHSGLDLDWKIDCDALTGGDWDCLTKLAIEMINRRGWNPSRVIGVPRGGLHFADCIRERLLFRNDINPNTGELLVVDDVYTTGNSIASTANAYLNQVEPLNVVHGIVIFARGKVKERWVESLFEVRY